MSVSRGLVLGIALIAAACGGQELPTSAPTTSASGPGSPSTPPPASTAPIGTPSGSSGSLGEALAMAGPLPVEIAFTDWAAVRRAADADSLTGASPFEEKARAIRNDPTPAGFGVRFLKSQATDWGFDVFDLDWEARIQVPGGVFWLLQLREGYSIESFTRRLDERGFATEPLAHGVLRTLPKVEFLALKPLSLLQNLDFMNTGILDGRRTLVLSATKSEAVRAILTQGPQPSVDPSLLSVARLLDDPVAAVLRVGDLCADAKLNIEPVLGNHAFVTLLDRAGTLRAYNALGIGYVREPSLRGRIVLGYPVAADAAADLEGRRLLADEGLSWTGVPYRLFTFTLTDARLEERSIVLDVASPQPPRDAPTTNPGSIGSTDIFPRSLMLTAANRDMLFGVCSD